MEFRPCIDIHNGSVKQIVGASLLDKGDASLDNYVSEKDAAFYANLYKKYGLKGGHVILLNPASSDFYEATKAQAVMALAAYPGGLQVGGGINDENARYFLEKGASSVIITSYIFHDGFFDRNNLMKLLRVVKAEELVLDLSCKKKNDGYYITTDRWQKDTNVKLSVKLFEDLADYCGEFLIHAVDVEGLGAGPDMELVKMLSEYCDMAGSRKVSYAGGIRSIKDLENIKKSGNNKINVTVGSALDLFGGALKFDDVVKFCDDCTELE